MSVHWRAWPNATAADRDTAKLKVTDFLQKRGYLTRARARPWNLATDWREPSVIAYREIDRPGGAE
ncbi:hypothetical protein GCM10010387_29230 [Streptomyces inusitatus]|uniref:Uncharacterized protein n=1 Tax=Streptomyces inusitatus TaxID=68221 RepID=A0A918Q7G5_9ACTN|nr:hypothetical protein GCM10010387_29230 [Streptomyces inusitatus]